MLFLQIVGGLFLFLIVFVLLGIPLGYTTVEKKDNSVHIESKWNSKE